MKGFYIHIPFCKNICSYCDFAKQIATEEVQTQYIDILLKELNRKRKYLKDVTSVYIGGGTPNSLSYSNLRRLLLALLPYLKKSTENTIEINPELLTEQQTALFARMKINRISIGVQTFQESILKKIRRKHTVENVKEAIRMLVHKQIQNINLDMMYGLPGQTMEDFKADVEQVLALPITHLSYYSLIVEEKTILFHQLRKNAISVPNDDLVADMYEYLQKRLSSTDFQAYEISNYAKKGYESIHNLGYWNCEEYVGIGASACGYIERYRYENESVLPLYFDHFLKQKEWISFSEAKKEFFLLGLRKRQGVSIRDYVQKFGCSPERDFDLYQLKKMGLIEFKNDIIRIKDDKILVSNLVFETFVR